MAKAFQPRLFMFDNIGKKLQILAETLCWLGIIASIIVAIVLWAQDSYWHSTAALGFGVLIGGCLVSWLSSLFLYAFGQLVEDIHNMRTPSCSNTPLSTPAEEPHNNDSDDVTQIKEYYYQLGYERMMALDYSLAAKFFLSFPATKMLMQKRPNAKAFGNNPHPGKNPEVTAWPLRGFHYGV